MYKQEYINRMKGMTEATGLEILDGIHRIIELFQQNNNGEGLEIRLTTKDVAECISKTLRHPAEHKESD